MNRPVGLCTTRLKWIFLLNKWWFDELYDWVFVRPALVLSNCVAAFDRKYIDWLIDNLARLTASLARIWDRVGDQTIVDGFVNGLASCIRAARIFKVRNAFECFASF